MRKVNPEIMQALLDEPEVKKHVEKMTPDEKTGFKKMLVAQGTYFHYEREQKRQKLKENTEILKENTAELKQSVGELKGAVKSVVQKPTRKRHKKKAD